MVNKKNAIRALILLVLIVAPIIYFQKTKVTNQTVHIYAYSSFTALWGPGPKIKELFEKKCQCQIVFHDASDSKMLVQRTTLEGASENVDVVVGVDQFDVESLSQKLGFRTTSTKDVPWVPEINGLTYPQGAVPFDWGVLTINYKKQIVNPPPTSFEDLLQERYKGKIAVQDPRTSSPGFQFLTWVLRTMGEDAGWKYLEKLSHNWHSVASNWSSSYGMFDKGIIDMVFSYTTSPIYHQVEEKVEKTFLLDFKIPVPMQVEFAAVAANCKNCEAGEEFIQFLLTPEIQKIIMEKNYMYPVVKDVIKGTPFEVENQFQPKLFSVTEDEKSNWIAKWKSLMSKGSL